MQMFIWILLSFLVVCAISASLSKNLLNSILMKIHAIMKEDEEEQKDE